MDDRQFTQPEVLHPLYHGLNLRVPEELGNQDLALLGYVDVTGGPFFADPSGQKDSTSAIQQAVNFARDHQMACFFPAGDYLVSETIECARGYAWRMGAIVPARHFPCMLVGSTKDSSKRARLILARNSAGFDDPENPKHVVRFWARGSVPRLRNNQEVMVNYPDRDQANIAYNQMFAGIDILIGEGNAGAIGIRLLAAQGAGVVNSTIDARHGFAGLEGGAGSGGSHFDITVIGGRIGLDLTKAQPAPTLAGIKLIGQTEISLRYSGSNTLSAVGLHIEPADGAVAIQCGNSGADNPFTGHLSLVDARIEYAQFNASTPAIETCKCLYMENVYFRNAATVVSIKGTPKITGTEGKWLCVQEYAKGAETLSIPHLSLFEYTYPIYVGGKTSDEICRVVNAEPPEALCSRHHWKGTLPSFDSNGVVNVKDAPYGARGDGQTDDSEALQRAFDENETVFLPKGHYRVTRPLKLKPNATVFGVSHTYSNIVVTEPGEHFADADSPKAVLETPDDANGNNRLAFFSVTIPTEAHGAHIFRHQSGNSEILFCRFAFHHHSPEAEARYLVDTARLTPPVVVCGNAGGKWFMHFEEQQLKEADYRHLLVAGTRAPLTFYHLNIEHVDADAQMEIRDCQNIRIFGMKSERNSPVLRIRDSQNIALYGYGGNTTAYPRKSLFEVMDSANVRLIGLVDLGLLHGLGYDHRFGVGTDPRIWTMVKVTSGSESYETGYCERPVVVVI